jgi:hypothetical protein
VRVTDRPDPAAPTADQSLDVTWRGVEGYAHLPAHGPTADDLWRWLLTCRVCGQEHSPRPVVGDPDELETWRHPDDGHAYLTRLLGGSFGRGQELRDAWNREAR